MKKSKIIVPALALIAFSTAASVTGTVAWFTASRSATITAGTYQIVSTTKGLEVACSGGLGTTASGSIVTVNDHTLLSDASFDHKDQLVFEPNTEGDGAKVAAGVSLDDADFNSKMVRAVIDNAPAGEGDEDDTVYSVLTWNVSFSIEFQNDGDSLGLFLDAANTGLTGGSASSTATGFRMAFLGQTSSVTETKVIAFTQNRLNAKYVDESAHFASGVNYTVAYDSTGPKYPDLISLTATNGTTNDLPADGAKTEAEAKQTNPYLGKLAFTANTKKTISFKVVCWFEGTDPNVINDKALDTVTATLGFKAIKLSA